MDEKKHPPPKHAPIFLQHMERTSFMSTKNNPMISINTNILYTIPLAKIGRPNMVSPSNITSRIQIVYQPVLMTSHLLLFEERTIQAT